LVVLAIVSYYAFFRSGAVPPPPAASDEISSASPKPTAPKGKDEPAGARKEDEREKKLSAPRDEPARSKDAEPEHAQPPVEQSQERGRTQESAEGVSKSRVYKEEKQESVRESANLPEAPANAAPANVAPGQKTFAPQRQVQSMKASPYPVTAESYLAPRDSLHIKDSLRADSLRKAKLDSLKKK
jgi:hypothetical protein